MSLFKPLCVFVCVKIFQRLYKSKGKCTLSNLYLTRKTFHPILMKVHFNAENNVTKLFCLDIKPSLMVLAFYYLHVAMLFLFFPLIQKVFVLAVVSQSLCVTVNINIQILANQLCRIVSIWTDGQMNLLQFYSFWILVVKPEVMNFKCVQGTVHQHNTNNKST